VAGLPVVVLVAAGCMFSGALDTDGQVWMWGLAASGRLGYPLAAPDAEQEAVPRSLGLAAFGGKKVVLISLRNGTATAVTERGALWVWGANDNRQMGLGDAAD